MEDTRKPIMDVTFYLELPENMVKGRYEKGAAQILIFVVITAVDIYLVGLWLTYSDNDVASIHATYPKYKTKPCIFYLFLSLLIFFCKTIKTKQYPNEHSSNKRRGENIKKQKRNDKSGIRTHAYNVDQETGNSY
jgi:hypothetical protein